VSREDPEAFLRELLAPLSGARPGRSLPGVPFSREAVANAFVMLGLLPEARAEEILAGYRTELEAKGFRFGILTGELSVRPGAYGYQDAQAASREDLTGIPLAVAAGPVPLPVPADSVAVELTLVWATLTPGGAKLRFSGASREDVQPSRKQPGRKQPGRQLHRVVFSQERSGLGLADATRTGMSVTDDLGRRYRLRPSAWRSSPRAAGQPGRRYDGEMLAEPEPAAGRTEPAATVSWLEFAAGPGPAVRVVMAAAAAMPSGPAEPPWPTPAECYLAQLSSAASISISTGDVTVEVEVPKIVAVVADALLRVGALPLRSALLSGGAPVGGVTPGASVGWREELKYHWGGEARRRAYAAGPERAGLAVALPLQRATAVIETIAAHEGYVCIQLYGHPWVTGEYWPMITPCFQVRAVDDTGAGHEGVRGSGGGRPEGSYEFWFWPPVAPEARRIRVTVSTLTEAAWAEVAIPGRS
jgi:hypothetical protein